MTLPRQPIAATAVLAAAVCLLPAIADAHPHVFVKAREEVVFGPDGLITGIRNTWKFDDMYSSFLVQGIGEPGKPVTRDQLAPLAKTNVDSLAEFGYFTVAKAAGKQSEFDPPVNYWLEQDADKILTLHFTLPLKVPASAGKIFTLLVYDPTYFVAFTLDDKDALSLSGAPPGCSVGISKPKPLEAADNQKLSESFFTNLSPGADLGIKLAERAIVACP